MMEKIKYTVLVVLATLGVLFIIIMLIPDDTDEPETAVAAVETEAEANNANTENASVETVASREEEEDSEEVSGETEESLETEEASSEAEEASPEAEEADLDSTEEETAETEEAEEPEGRENARISIPESEISDYNMEFQTETLDGRKVSDSIFKDYDLTVVHVWQTDCDSCLYDMGDYARYYKELPGNVNLIGIIGDVYEGTDNNVSEAERILGNAGAEFMNLRTSDSTYEVTGSIQYVPSTFFVDKKGRIVGMLLEGAGFSDVKNTIDVYVR